MQNVVIFDMSCQGVYNGYIIYRSSWSDVRISLNKHGCELRKGCGHLMSYDDKVRELTNAIRCHVQFKDVAQAEEYWNSYRFPANDKITLEIEHLVEQLLLYAGCQGLNIADILSDIGVEGTYDVRRAALREAIRQCARDFLDKREQRIERELAAVG